MSDANPPARGYVELAELGDATLVNLRNEAMIHGQTQFAAEVDKEIEARAAPELYRHSRRRRK